MKYLVILFIILLCLSSLRAQILTQEEKERIILALNDSSLNVRSSALEAIEEYQILEAEDNLKSNIWRDNRSIQIEYLKALLALNSSATEEYTLAYLDTLDVLSFGKPKFASYILELKVRATKILFELQNYSTVGYVFDLIQQDKPAVNIWAIDLLPQIIRYVPSYAELAKNELIYASINALSEIDRLNSMVNLIFLFGEEELPLLLSACENDESPTIRSSVIAQFLPNEPIVNTTLRIRLYQEEESTIRSQIIDFLLFRFGSASDFKYVSDYIIQETDSLVKRLTINTLNNYTPPPPDSTNSIESLIDSLSSSLVQCFNFEWVGDQLFKDNFQSILQSAKTNIQNGDSLTCRADVKLFQDSVNFVYTDSLNPDPRFVTLEGWKFLYWNAQYILDRLPEPSANPNLLVTLTNSQGTQIPASNVKYYDTSWKDAQDNGDGTFTVITTKPTVSVRMFYEYANQTVNNVPAQNNTYTFQTVNAEVELRNSLGNLIDEGTVQYYAGAWRSFGTTVNGVANKELLPINYSFRMTYEYGNIDKQQDISVDPTVVFQTVNAAVELRNSKGNLIDQGTVQYYAGAWRSFGTTVNGVANKELLPKNYSFRMTYEYVSNDKQQDLSTNSTVTFSTVLCTLKVSDANNQPLEGANTKYYSGAWRDIGLTNTSGEITKELLPKNLSFRAIYGSVSQDKQQDIGVNSLVEIQLNTQ